MNHGLQESPAMNPAADMDDEDDKLDLAQIFSPLLRHWRLWLGGTVLAGLLGWGGSYLITPTFTATTTLLPPQQQQSIASSALASLGSLAGLAGAGTKSPADEYVSLMHSVTVSDRMIDRFKLMELYHAKYRRNARQKLNANTQITVGKKDGMIAIVVQDESPERAAAMANQYVEELRRMTSVLAVSEAQQRRVFFEKQMQDTKQKLIAAQSALQESGFTSAAMKAEPRAAADEYARVRADMTAADVRLQTLRNSMTESSPEVQRQEATLQALRSKVAQLEQSSRSNSSDPDYVSRYREFKYQEAFFDTMTKQYEIARVDESREGALIQVVDPALVPEDRSWPRRSFVAAGVALIAAFLLALWLVVRDRRQRRAFEAIAPNQL
jgi:uncharacterized protein involved in exopolysaccharide biosynthesis